MRKAFAAIAIAITLLPAAFTLVVVIPAAPAHAFMDNWWVDWGWAVENDPDRPNVEFRVCPMRYNGGVPFTVDYATSDGTATAGLDYVATAGTLLFLPTINYNRCQTVQVPVLDDDLYEMGDEWWSWGEYFHFDLSNPSAFGPPIDEDAHTLGFIEDDYDDWPVEFAADDRSVAEGGTVDVPVRIYWERSWPVSIHYEAVGGTASGQDFTAASGDLTFEPGENRKYVSIPTTQDSLNEAAETFELVLSNNQPAHRTSIYKGATVTITDDDPLPRVSIDDVTVAGPVDRALEAPFTVSLLEASGRDVEVAFSTTDGSAVAGRDYEATEGTLTFPAGVTSQTISVPVLPNREGEGGAFSLALEAPVNATLEKPSAVARIDAADTSTVAAPPEAAAPEAAPPASSST